MRAAIAIGVGAVAGWFLSPYVWDSLRIPLQAAAAASHTSASINFTTVSSAFDLRIQIALCIGIVVSAPVWLYQLFAFFVPGLKPRERRYTLGFSLTAFPLFLLGGAAGWLALPRIVGVMTSFAPAETSTFVDAHQYLDFTLKLVLAVGVAFVLPVLIVLLNFVGVVESATIRRGWRIAILAVFVFAAIATPSADVLSMFLLAAPMLVLYLVAVAITTAHDRRLRKRLDAVVNASVPEMVA